MTGWLLAAAGSGSSGFGGGGGAGGGGGGFTGGGGAGGPIGTVIGIVGMIVLAGYIVLFLWRTTARAGERGRRGARVHAVRRASAEAAADDPAFAVETVEQDAAELFRDVTAAWSALDLDRLRTLVGGDLMNEWRRRLRDFQKKGWRNETTILRGPHADYVGLVNRAADAEDRVTVRIRATLRDVVIDRHGRTITGTEQSTRHITQTEYWTLAKRDGRWILVSIEQEAEGAHHLRDELVATPWGDDARLHDEALTELAAADAIPDADIAEVSNLEFDGDARTAALDLSVVDGRFAPAVLEAAARRVVAAWAEAVDGDDAALRAMASPAAARRLLHGDDRRADTRVVVRGPQLRRLKIAALDAAAQPPTITVEAELRGRRYREDRDTAAVLDGSKDRARRFTERWTLALEGDGWRLV